MKKLTFQNYLKKLATIKKKGVRGRTSKIEEIEKYILLAKNYDLKIDTQVNYNNEVVVNLSNFEKEAKRIRKKETKEEE